MPFRSVIFGVMVCVGLMYGVLGAAAPALAGDAAQTAYDNGQYEQALNIWRQHAKSGDTDAQNHLGEMYRKGHGVERNFKKAANWFAKAAKRGNAAAQFNLGSLYRTGKGIKKNARLAAKWYQRAAKQGFAKAQFSWSDVGKWSRSI